MITSMSNTRVKQVVQWQNKAKERKRDGVFLAEGFKMFEEAPVSWIREVYLSEGALEKRPEEMPAVRKLQEVSYETVSQEVFARMSDTQTPQGILTVLRQPEYRLEDLLGKPFPLLLVLEDLQDPGNLGTIIRTGEGAGVTGIILTGQTVDPFNPKTIRSTMGSVYRVPFTAVRETEGAVKSLQKSGVKTYAAHLKGVKYYDAFSYREPTAFLIGNEGNGLRPGTASLADEYLKIPMEGQVESLNAAVAASLLMYEAYRQRRG